MVMKKVLIFIVAFVLFFNISIYSAVVSDNDGSAFITKAEYDSLKNNFQSQLDQYNTSLDSKIDSAIASYIAGITAEKTTELTNIYDYLGGGNIRFGFPDINPTTKEISGGALYYLNCWRSGFLVIFGGAGYNAIKVPSESTWYSDNAGRGQYGAFITYDKLNYYKYLSSYKYGMLQACYTGGWYRVHELVDSIQEYPFGTVPTVLGESVVVGDMTLVDCELSSYRAYLPTDIDLTNWTSAYGIDSAENKYFIDNEEYNKPSAYRQFTGNMYINGTTQTVYPPSYHSRGGNTTNGSISINNIRIYDWKYDTDSSGNLSTYLNLIPGFYKNKKYRNTLFGGVQFFETGKDDGKIKITKLNFTRYEKTGTTVSTTGDVYFAINVGAFDNIDALEGTERFTKVTGATLYDASRNLYKATVGTEVSIEFDGKKNRTYFIKCQPNTAVAAKNDLYCGIENGAEITITSK